MGDRRGGDRQKEDRRAEVDPRGYAKPEEYGGYTYAPNATNPRPTKLKLKTHWIPGEGIDREVLQGEVQRFLGPEATCAPQVHEGRNGYKITALRTFTPEMVVDLRRLSEEYSRESSRGRKAPSYQDSQTRQDVDMLYSQDQSGYGSSTSYPPGYPGMGKGPSYPYDYERQQQSMATASSLSRPSTDYGYPPSGGSSMMYGYTPSTSSSAYGGGSDWGAAQANPYSSGARFPAGMPAGSLGQPDYMNPGTYKPPFYGDPRNPNQPMERFAGLPYENSSSFPPGWTGNEQYSAMPSETGFHGVTRPIRSPAEDPLPPTRPPGYGVGKSVDPQENPKPSKSSRR